jgi:hypothetical protein
MPLINPTKKNPLIVAQTKKKKKYFPFSFYFSPLPSHLTGVYSITRQQHRLNSCPYIVSPLFWFLNDCNWSENINSPGKRKEKKRRGTTAIKSRRWSASETDDNNQVNNITKKEVPL